VLRAVARIFTTYGSFENKCPISEKATLARRASKGLRFAEFPLCFPRWRVGLVCDNFFRTSHKIRTIAAIVVLSARNAAYGRWLQSPYPGIGWAIWRDEADVPASLVTETNVLGFVERSFSLNFSRGAGMILAQYYNFLRLGREGYTQIQNAMRENARYLAKGVEAMGVFNMINSGELTPSCCCSLKDESRYNAADLVAALAQHGWTIPAFSLPPDADTVNGMRMNVREQFSRDMADILLGDIKSALAKLEATHSKPHGTVGTHHH